MSLSSINQSINAEATMNWNEGHGAERNGAERQIKRSLRSVPFK